MEVFLAAVPLAGRRILVLGPRERVEPKLRLARRTVAQVLWFSPGEIAPEAVEGVAAQDRWPDAADVADVALVFIGVEAHDDAQADAVAALARRAGAWVNVVDQPARCDFQTPALIDRGDVVVGVATGGVAPVMARDLRARIEAAIPPNTRLLAKLAREIRPAVVSSPLDGLGRRRFWETALRGEVARLADEGREAEARAAMAALLEGFGGPDRKTGRGALHVVCAGPGDPELLTLKGLRLLQDADLVLADEAVPDLIVDYARRDARRLRVARGHTLEALVLEELAAGSRVVRLLAGGAVDPQAMADLGAAAAEAVVSPGVG